MDALRQGNAEMLRTDVRGCETETNRLRARQTEALSIVLKRIGWRISKAGRWHDLPRAHYGAEASVGSLANVVADLDRTSAAVHNSDRAIHQVVRDYCATDTFAKLDLGLGFPELASAHENCAF